MDALGKNPEILSPAKVWEDFTPSLPLKESKVSEDVIDNVVYNHMYFYGRDTGQGRVRIYAVYAKNRVSGKKTPKAGLLIIPDIGQTVDLTIIDIYVRQGYAVLMVDYCGETDTCENYTKYPECIAYANVKKAGRAIDYCDASARETAWYEWAAVVRYGISFLKNQYELEKIGVLGIKNGANIGWQVCGLEKRVDCFVPLFGAGWRAYKGIYKYSSDEIEMNDERLRFLAGVDAHAYAQYVSCPVFYMTATNSAEFDCDRAMDTVSRYPMTINFSPRLSGVLDRNCKRNVDIFLAKYLLGFRVVLPRNPKIVVNCENKDITAVVDIDFSDQLRPKKISVYLAEDGENPAFRDWVEMTMSRNKEENVKTFRKTINGNCAFVNVVAVVEYKNGLTVSSVMTNKKTPKINSRRLNLVYSSSDKLSSFAVANPDKSALGGIFFEDTDPVEYVEGSNKISGVCSKYGLVCYKFNKRTVDLNERSLIVVDVNSKDYSVLKITLTTEENGGINEYSYTVAIRGGDIWQNVIIKCNDFKSDRRLSVRDYSAITSIRFESEAKCIFNNLLIV